MSPVEYSISWPNTSYRWQVGTREIAPGWIFMDKATFLHSIWILVHLMAADSSQ